MAWKHYKTASSTSASPRFSIFSGRSSIFRKKTTSASNWGAVGPSECIAEEANLTTAYLIRMDHWKDHQSVPYESILDPGSILTAEESLEAIARRKAKVLTRRRPTGEGLLRGPFAPKEFPEVPSVPYDSVSLRSQSSFGWNAHGREVRAESAVDFENLDNPNFCLAPFVLKEESASDNVQPHSESEFQPFDFGFDTPHVALKDEKDYQENDLVPVESFDGKLGRRESGYASFEKQEEDASPSSSSYSSPRLPINKRGQKARMVSWLARNLKISKTERHGKTSDTPNT